MALGHFKDAEQDFAAVVELAPRDKDARTKLQECERASRKHAFQQAIASSGAPGSSAPEKAKYMEVSEGLQHMEVPESYIGLKFGPMPPTASEIQEMIAEFRAGHTIHTKFAYAIMIEAIKVLKVQPTLVELAIPSGGKFTICGDIHGQFFDLCKYGCAVSKIYFLKEYLI